MNSSFNILEYSYYSWSLFASIILSTSNRLYIGWFGILMFLLLGLSIVSCFCITHYMLGSVGRGYLYAAGFIFMES